MKHPEKLKQKCLILFISYVYIRHWTKCPWEDSVHRMHQTRSVDNLFIDGDTNYLLKSGTDVDNNKDQRQHMN